MMPGYPSNAPRSMDAAHLAPSSAMQAANGALLLPMDCTVVRKMAAGPDFVSVLSGKINTVYDLDEVLAQ